MRRGGDQTRSNVRNLQGENNKNLFQNRDFSLPLLYHHRSMDGGKSHDSTVTRCKGRKPEALFNLGSEDLLYF